MFTGVIFWYGNEVGLEYEKIKAFPREHKEVIDQKNQYRYLYNLLKERKGPSETFQSLMPELSYRSQSSEEHSQEVAEQIDKRLDQSCKAVLQQLVLDSN